MITWGLAPDPLGLFAAYREADPEGYAKGFRPGLLERLYPGQLVYEFRDGEGLAGWGALVPDVYGSTAATLLGVWPGHARRGVRREIIRVLIEEGFTRLPIAAICPVVLLSNAAHAVRVLEEVRDRKTPWRFSHVSTVPWALCFVLTRDDWALWGDRSLA